MKQILQSLKTGAIEVADVPCPTPGHGQLLIATTKTLVSAGTERMLLDFGRSNWLNKARQQPDKVKLVLSKIVTDGLAPTLDAVRNKLDQPLALGYCNVGRVAALGEGVTGFDIGDRVVSNGKHSEVVCVPVNLTARVPDSVPDDAAAFVVLGAIALQGIRLVEPTLGECVVVTGLGLIGLMTVQLLRAHGCRVLGIDFDESRLALARRFGAEVVNPAAGEDALAAAHAFSRGRGIDAVIITATTDSNEPVHQAAQMSRKRGRIVLVGVTGLQLSRADFYEKELSLQVSCSYGPGRYDPAYEEKGQDYPAGFVRWTEQRNFEAVLDMMADGRLDVRPLVSHRFEIDDAQDAYGLLTNATATLGILLDYPNFAHPIREGGAEGTVTLPAPQIPNASSTKTPSSVRPVIGFIGSGSYATGTLIPAFKATGARLQAVASRGGVSSLYACRKFGFAEATTDVDRLLNDPQTNAVVISTRHDSHAQLVVKALEAGKHVFVEKPLCLSLVDLVHIEATVQRTGRKLMVGFNRRFAPHVIHSKKLMEAVSEPKAFVLTVNAGVAPADHWTLDPKLGGGRIVGEACHFVDLLRHLAGAPIKNAKRFSIGKSCGDTATLQLEFSDGSIGTVHYFANGSKRVAKERLEVFTAGRILQLDNFRRLSGFGWPKLKTMRLWRQDKGHKACAAAFVRMIEDRNCTAIPLEDIPEVSRVSIELGQA